MRSEADTISTSVDALAGSRGDPGRVVCLASRSPRRRELLNEFGFEHLSQHPGVEDSLLEPGIVTPEQWVAALAYLKAAMGATLEWKLGGRPALILGADTVCVKDRALIGTPVDAGDAARIIRLLSDGTHAVVTGVALIDVESGRRVSFVDRAVVHVGPLPTDEIERYVASGDWAGKAGAYNLRERITAGWPIRFEGDATTIMGLPMGVLVPRLASLGVRPRAERAT